MVAEISRKYVRSSKLTKTMWSCDLPYIMQTAVTKPPSSEPYFFDIICTVQMVIDIHPPSILLCRPLCHWITHIDKERFHHWVFTWVSYVVSWYFLSPKLLTLWYPWLLETESEWHSCKRGRDLLSSDLCCSTHKMCTWWETFALCVCMWTWSCDIFSVYGCIYKLRTSSQ